MSTRKGFMVVVLVVMTMLIISSVALAGGFWKAKPTTPDGCVTTYRMPDASAPIGSACFRWTKVSPGYFNCVGNICFVKTLSGDDWLRTDEVAVTN